MPATLWTGLPGRELLHESLALIGESDIWYPASLAPSRTLIALLSLLPVVAVLTLTSNFSRREWQRTMVVIVLLNLGVLFLGGVQILLDGQFLLYSERVRTGYLYGTFANHNTAGIMFVLSFCALSSLYFQGSINEIIPKIHGGLENVFVCVVSVLFALAVILTQSRSSIIILVVTFILLSVIFFHDFTVECLLKPELSSSRFWGLVAHCSWFKIQRA